MPAKKPPRKNVTCPHCGHRQPEPPSVYSTVCKSCHQHFRLREADSPESELQPPPRGDRRRVDCFQCGTALDVPSSAQSTMCKRCSSHVDLQDYTITSTVSKNFKTKGRFVIESSGYLLNTDTIAGDVILKGRLIGKLKAEGILELHPSAVIKGSFEAGRLIIPPGARFAWLQLNNAHTVDLRGELVVELCAIHTLILRSSARFFGNIQVQNLIVESGAVVVGNAKIGRSPEETDSAP